MPFLAGVALEATVSVLLSVSLSAVISLDCSSEISASLCSACDGKALKLELSLLVLSFLQAASDNTNARVSNRADNFFIIFCSFQKCCVALCDIISLVFPKVNYLVYF